MDTNRTADTDTTTTAERQELNRRMSEWFGIGITRVHTSDDDEDADSGEWNRWEV
jgi:hypothetical protein